LDPNIWFNNVEVVVSEKIGRETVQYVSNIYKYYLAYQIIEEQRGAREGQRLAQEWGGELTRGAMRRIWAVILVGFILVLEAGDRGLDWGISFG
jgi:hypothetical protein